MKSFSRLKLFLTDHDCERPVPCKDQHTVVHVVGSRKGASVNFTGFGPRPFVVVSKSMVGRHFNAREAHREAAVLRKWRADEPRGRL